MKRWGLWASILLVLVCVCACAGPVDVVAPPADPAFWQQTPQPVPETTLSALQQSLAQARTLGSGSKLLRKFPYPYRAMLALTSDCDSSTRETFLRMHRFLNTLEETDYGTGLGLDIADSFFMYNGSNSTQADNLLCYCEGTDPTTLRDAEFIKKYYDCGWYDSIHALGDFSHSRGPLFTRELAVEAWRLLEAADIAPSIWIDHGNVTNVQNFGAYSRFTSSRYQDGDNPHSPYYHTDVTLKTSIRYAWYSRHSDEFGHDFPLKLRKLRDGSKVWTFQRYTSENIDKEIYWLWRPNRLHEQITAEKLDQLEQRGQYAIIAQHLTIFQSEDWLQQADVDILRLLATRHYESQSILVARTSRLLDYAVAQKYLRYQVAEAEGYTAIRILSIDDPSQGERTPQRAELCGLTFYCNNPFRTLIMLGDTLLPAAELQYNRPDETGLASISIPWFAADTTDYTQL